MIRVGTSAVLGHASKVQHGLPVVKELHDDLILTSKVYILEALWESSSLVMYRKAPTTHYHMFIMSYVSTNIMIIIIW